MIRIQTNARFWQNANTEHISVALLCALSRQSTDQSIKQGLFMFALLSKINNKQAFSVFVYLRWPASNAKNCYDTQLVSVIVSICCCEMHHLKWHISSDLKLEQLLVNMRVRICSGFIFWLRLIASKCDRLSSR